MHAQQYLSVVTEELHGFFKEPIEPEFLRVNILRLKKNCFWNSITSNILLIQMYSLTLGNSEASANDMFFMDMWLYNNTVCWVNVWVRDRCVTEMIVLVLPSLFADITYPGTSYFEVLWCLSSISWNYWVFSKWFIFSFMSCWIWLLSLFTFFCFTISFHWTGECNYLYTIHVT